MLIIQN